MTLSVHFCIAGQSLPQPLATSTASQCKMASHMGMAPQQGMSPQQNMAHQQEMSSQQGMARQQGMVQQVVPPQYSMHPQQDIQHRQGMPAHHQFVRPFKRDVYGQPVPQHHEFSGQDTGGHMYGNYAMGLHQGVYTPVYSATQHQATLAQQAPGQFVQHQTRIFSTLQQEENSSTGQNTSESK